MCSQESNIADSGDFVNSDDDEENENFWFTIEPGDLYDQGLYYPIFIGEILDQRYLIQHKLGHGGFSTVWMAHDLLEKKDVALKITRPGEDSEHEYWIQSEIIRTAKKDSGLITYLRTFRLCTPTQTFHQVFVFPLCGPSLQVCQRTRPIVARISAAKYLLQALKALHQAKIVHRDLNPSAVMWEMHSLSHCDTATKYSYFGRPQKAAFEAWKRGELVKPMEVHPRLLTSKVYLGDFGLAIKAGTSVEQKQQCPAACCAPERYHGVDPSLMSDMWSYMCIFTQLYMGITPFFPGGGWGLLIGWRSTLGPLPVNWKGHCTVPDIPDMDLLYDQSKPAFDERTLGAKLAHTRPEISVNERNLAVAVFAKVFCYEPEHRVTASELLEDSSFKALMAIYGC